MFTLITAASSSLAYKLKNTLDAERVLLGDYVELPELMLQSGKMLKLPDPKSASYTHQVLSLCLDKNIDTIYVLRTIEAGLLLASQQLFTEYGIAIIINDDTIQ